MKFAETETTFHANQGLDEVVAFLKPFQQHSNLTEGDFIQFAAAVAVSNCPGAPPLNAFIGRPEATQPAPDGLVPEPFGKPMRDVLIRCMHSRDL